MAPSKKAVGAEFRALESEKAEPKAAIAVAQIGPITERETSSSRGAALEHHRRCRSDRPQSDQWNL